MSTDLASLVIGLRADVATLQSDLGKAAALNARYAKDASDRWTSASDVIQGALVGIAGSLAAAFSVSSLVDFGKRAIDTADQFNKMAQKVGISVESLSALDAQAKLSDVSVESLQGGLVKLAKNAADAAAGGKDSAATFAAMGVSLKDSNGNLKSTQELLQAVATKFAGYEDSAAKTALAQKAFGKSGADLIPLLNQLGEQGFKKVTEEAQKYGQVISTETAAQAEEFNDNLTKTQFGLSAIANEIVADLLPSLVKSSAAFAEWINSDAVRSGVKGLVDDITGLASILAQVPAEIAATDAEFRKWNGTLSENHGSLDIILDKLKSFTNFKPGAPLTVSWTEPDWLKSINTPSGINDKFTAAETKPIIDLGLAARGVVQDVEAASTGFDHFAKHVDAAALSAAKAKAPIVEAGDAAAKLAQIEAQASQFLSSLDSVGADKYTQALSKYNEQLDKANELYAKLIKNGESAAKATEFLNDANQRAKAGFDAVVQGMRNANDANAILEISYAKAESDINEQIRLLGLDEQSRKADELATRLTIAALGDLKDFMGPLTQAQQDLIDKNKALAERFVATSDAMQKQQEVTREYANIWAQAGNSIADTFAKTLVEGGNFMKSLADIAKQVVEQIIAYFAKLAVINPILNAVFGGSAGFSLLPTMANAAGLGGGASGGAGGSAGNASTLAGMGSQIFSGFQGAFDSFLFGQAGSGTSSGLLGTTTYGSFSNSFAPSALGYGAAFAGGAYAGYQRYQNSAGGAAGVAGGLTYGVGTAALGLGAASLAGGGGLIAGLSVLGPIGWVALGLMVIDTMSGGKLFGTKGKFNFGEQALTVGAGGASVTAGYDLKGQQALFGGSTHSWQSLPTDPAAQKAADDFYKALKGQTEEFAKQFGATVGDIVGGQFIATFDKKGNVTATSSTVLGKTYSEDQQHFEERLSAENMLAVLDSLNKGLSDAVDQYRADADQLMAVTQALAQGEAMIQAGTTFLALGSDQSLTALLALAQGMQGFGETIDQTLQRIEQAQSQYDAFVGQFKPADTFASPFQAALADIDAQMEQNIATANSLAQAAGAEGAATEDLVHIHEFAAAQFAAAVKKLESDANSLVASLGYGMPQSLSDINSQIAELESQANSGSGAIGGFGDAMQSAAQAATNAMNLLLGDLSPLNDQQKLQTALQGLRAGTVTAEQVLEIGRRLYATGSDYNALFSQVMAMNRGAHAMVGASGGGGGGLSPGDQQRLADLKAERDKQQAIQQHSDALTLAQQIADIAGATGMSIDDVLKQIGLDDLPDFMKELGVTDKTGFDNFIEKLEQNKDSAGENTAQIADKIDLTNTLLQQIRDGTTGPAAPPGTPTGHSGHALQQNTDAVNNLNTTIQSGGNTGNRSSRGGFDRAVLQRTR